MSVLPTLCLKLLQTIRYFLLVKIRYFTFVWRQLGAKIPIHEVGDGDNDQVKSIMKIGLQVFEEKFLVSNSLKRSF